MLADYHGMTGLKPNLHPVLLGLTSYVACSMYLTHSWIQHILRVLQSVLLTDVRRPLWSAHDSCLDQL